MAAPGPLGPEVVGLTKHAIHVDGRWQGFIRAAVGQGKNLDLAGLQNELHRERARAGLGHRRGGAECGKVRSELGDPGVFSITSGGGGKVGFNPRNDVAVVEAQGEFHIHADCSAGTADDAHQIGVVATDRHEISDDYRPG